MSPRSGHLYLLLPGDIGLGAVKVGRTCSLRGRVRSYPPGSRFLLATGVLEDCHAAERLLIRHFRTLFRLVAGREYFQASPEAAMAEFRRICAPMSAAGPTPMDWCAS